MWLSRFAGAWRFIQKPGGGDIQRLGDFGENHDGRVAHAALDAADIGAVQAAIKGKALLREPELLPYLPDIEAHLAAYIHAREVSALLTIGLQTMSLILLDFGCPASHGWAMRIEIQKPLAPSNIRYLKLGRGGCWEQLSLERGEIHFGYKSVSHELCIAGDWDAVQGHLLREGKHKGDATESTGALRDFYTLGSDCLWVTFADGHLWWTFAQPGITWLGPEEENQGARMRQTIGGWRNTTLQGVPLRIETLSSRLTAVAAYRKTLCRIKDEAYLLRRLNGIEEPLVVEARAAQDAMRSITQEMIAALHWADFEVLVDLIFARTGWQRISALGETQKDIDLALVQPLTGERAFVQVKSSAIQTELEAFTQSLTRRDPTARLFFVCHSPRGALAAPDHPRLQILSGPALAEAALKAGLYDWLIERVG